jgi:hypothetical protein
MSKRDKAPAAVEGSELLVVGQDIRPLGLPRPLKDSGELAFPLSVQTRGESTIIQESSPKTPKFRPYSMLDQGSCILGSLLWGFSTNPLKRDSIKVGGKGRTSSHPGQSLTITGSCFMEIIKGWRGNPLPTHPKQELLK